MRPFSSGELTRMQAVQEAAMQDTCELLSYAEAGRDEYNMPIEDFSQAAVSVCGFDPTVSREVLDGAQVALTDAVLRLPIDADVAQVDRVRITHRYGVALDTPPVYEVIGLPQRGPSGLVLNLRLAPEEI